MEKLKHYWHQFSTRVDNYKPRERALLFLAVIAAIVFTWDSYLYRPDAVRLKAANNQILQVRGEVQQLQLQGDEIRARAQIDPNREVNRDLAGVRQQLERTDAQLAELGQQFIPPAQKPLLLRQILERHKRLRLLEMVNLPAQPLFDEPTEGEKGAVDDKQPKLYRHGLRLQMSGNYLDLVAYLKDLEALPWRFYWDNLTLQVQEHPNAQIVLTVYTLSLDKRWIGV